MFQGQFYWIWNQEQWIPSELALMDKFSDQVWEKVSIYISFVNSIDDFFLFQDNFVFGQSGAGNNWAKGHYTEGKIEF